MAVATDQDASPRQFWLNEDPDHVFVIAEIGVNHNGVLDIALRLIDAAADSGADAVKFQTFQTSELVTETADQAAYQSKNLGKVTSQAEMLRKLELSRADYQAILRHCEQRNIKFLSTPFDLGSADFLEELGVDGFKVSSGDLNYFGLLRHLASKSRPIILSSGMATIGDIENALECIGEVADVPLAVLHCVSNYPCAPEECNLRAMDAMAAAFPSVTIGWSDHSEGDAIGIAACARDHCKIIEKHFTLDRTMEGPDHKASLEPSELKHFVTQIRSVRRALGTGRKIPTESERNTAMVAKRVLVAAKNLSAGQQIGSADLALKRSGSGLPPSMEGHVIGSRAIVDLPKDTPLALAHLDFSNT